MSIRRKIKKFKMKFTDELWVEYSIELMSTYEVGYAMLFVRKEIYTIHNPD